MSRRPRPGYRISREAQGYQLWACDPSGWCQDLGPRHLYPTLAAAKKGLLGPRPRWRPTPDPRWVATATRPTGLTRAEYLAQAERRRHGNASRYWAGCRCDACRAALAQREREQRRVAWARPTPDYAHGTVSGYHYWGCRCDRCRAASYRARGITPTRRNKDPVRIAEARRLRASGMWTLRAIAAQVGVSVSTVAKWTRQETDHGR